MSGAKDLLAKMEQQYDVGTQIAIEAKVLRVCEFHGEAYDSGDDPTPAYKLGVWKFTHGKLGDVFADTREVTDAIKHAVEDHPAETCPRCDRDD